MSFLFTNSSMPNLPSSRPKLDRFTPPNGSSALSAPTKLTKTMPARAGRRPGSGAAFHAEPVQPNRADSGHPDAGVVTLEEHVAYAWHPEGLPAIGPTVAS